MAEGYFPPRDQMRSIVDDARAFYRTARRWQRALDLPDVPIDRANAAALKSIFSLERSINPGRHPLGRERRAVEAVRAWPDEAGDGIAWLLNMIDGLQDRHGLEDMRTAETYDAWFNAAPLIPEVVRIDTERLQSFRTAIRWLSRSADLQGDRSAERKVTPVRAKDSPSSIPIELCGPERRPWINGEATSRRLTSAEYRLVAALIDGPAEGMSVPDLEAVASNAIEIIRDLLHSADAWGSVILPWADGLGYAVVGHEKVWLVWPECEEGGDQISCRNLPPENQAVPKIFVASMRSVAVALGYSEGNTKKVKNLPSTRVRMWEMDSEHETAFQFLDTLEHTKTFIYLRFMGKIKGSLNSPPVKSNGETCPILQPVSAVQR